VKSTETIKLALASIWAHKLRSSLTLLGMVVGVSAVVVIASLIHGFNLDVDEKIVGLGAKYFTIDRFSLDDFRSLDAITAAMRRNPPLKMDEHAYLEAHATLIGAIGVRARATAQFIKRGNLPMTQVPVDGATATSWGSRISGSPQAASSPIMKMNPRNSWLLSGLRSLTTCSRPGRWSGRS